MPAVSDRLPIWTWWLPLPIFFMATWLALATRFSDAAAFWHLPFALGLVGCLWWGAAGTACAVPECAVEHCAVAAGVAVGRGLCVAGNPWRWPGLAWLLLHGPGPDDAGLTPLP